MQTKSVGIDVGLESLVSFSDGRKVAPLKALRKHEAKLRRLQRSVSRKKRGSNNRKKTVRKLAKEHLRIKRIRTDFLHKLSTVVVRENQAITVEQLKIPNMMKNHKLAKSIADASWGEFIRQLEYKSAWHGRDFQKVSARNTSKTCSSCGAVVEQMSLSVRRWQCETCQTWHDRDTNAAINIKERATKRCQKNTEQIAVGQTVIAWETYIEH
jgi:putative transposase